jgi:tetratricopeptide (TPR) repeat protein
MLNFFIARERELSKVRALLDQGKILAICGQPGVGKSALAMKIIDAANADWCLLDLLEHQTKESLRGHERFLTSKKKHWLFDNADGALSLVAERASEIRKRNPSARILITSCEPMLRPDVVRIELMAFGSNNDGDAIRLFHAAYAACKTDIPYTEAMAESVAVASEGMPEAIIAAATQAAKGERDPAAWLARGEYLHSAIWHGARSRAERMQTYWERLTEIERRVLLLLSQWNDSVSNALIVGLPHVELAAAERLAAHSLLLRNADRSRWSTSYHLRTYVRTLIRSSQGIRDMLQQMAHGLASRDEHFVLDLDASRSHHETAHDAWAMVPVALDAHDFGAAASLAFHASRLFLVRGPLDIYESHLTDLIQKVPEPFRANLFLIRGITLLFGGAFKEAERDLQVALRGPDRITRIQAQSKLGLLCGLQNRTKESASWFKRAEEALGSRDEPNLRGMVMKDHANTLVELRSPHAQEYIARARLSFRKANNERELMFLELLEATIACEEGDVERVERIVTELTPRLVRADEGRRLSRAKIILGVALLDQGRSEEALHPLTEAISLSRAIADVGSAGIAACYLAQGAILSKKFSEAADWALVATEELQHLGDPVWLGQGWLLLAAAYAAQERDVLALDALQSGTKLLRTSKPSVRRTVANAMAKALSEILRGKFGKHVWDLNASEEERSAARIMRTLEGKRSRADAADNGKRRIKIQRLGEYLVDVRGKKVSLETFPVLRSILSLLVERYLKAPDQTIRAQEMIAAAWPSERILPAAAKNRLYVAIRRLRLLGLEHVLEAAAGGYKLVTTSALDIVA